MTDLHSLVSPSAGDVRLENAWDINNRGQILVSVTVIPEPETYAMLLAGLAVIGAGAWRKKDIACFSRKHR